MRDAVVVGAVRRSVGKRNGGPSGGHPVDLGAHVLTAVAERTGSDPAGVEDVIFGRVAVTTSEPAGRSWHETVGPLAYLRGRGR